MSDDEERSMSAHPVAPLHPLTVSEYLALPEDQDVRHELVEGVLVMSTSPTWDHNEAMHNMRDRLRSHLPRHLRVNCDLDVDLRLVAPTEPGTVRRPDVLVADRTAVQRIRVNGGALHATDLVLAVEVISPSSRRTDRIVKLAEYADAGIPHYWIVDLDQPVSLLAYRLTAEFGYVESAHATGTFTAEEPFPVTVELHRLI